jgi:hypothetical protein
MIQVDNKQKYMPLFREYTHNIPVIYASIEGQYDGTLFVDAKDDTQIAVLFTPFAFHYVAGNPEIDGAADVLDTVIFKEYLAKKGQREAIVFSPNEKWDHVLDEVFSRHRGIKDGRKIFSLNHGLFGEVRSASMALDGVRNELVYEADNGANMEYPVSRIIKGTECISYCSGFMLGHGHAEIDVATMEPHRGKGYAKEASIILIDELLRNGIEPDWCTWPYRIASEKLALSLGFELLDTVPAHIWVEEECGKIESIL